MLSATELARRLGCEWHTIKEAIERGEINAVKVGRTWAIAEDQLLQNFKKRLESIERTRRRRSLRLKAVWELAPERMKPPPHRVTRRKAKVAHIRLEPLSGIATADDPTIVWCPSCHRHLRAHVKVVIAKETVKKL